MPHSCAGCLTIAHDLSGEHAGVSFRSVLNELTVSEPALRKWMAATTSGRAKAPPRLRPVAVKSEAAPTPPPSMTPNERALTMITPSGFRVEGLDGESVAA